MADVFISYSQKDRDIARDLANFVRDCGYDVWWDFELVGGVKFRNKIKDELSTAKAAIVIWTQNSAESDWVIEEAEEAKAAGKLIPVVIDGLDPRAIPFGFRGLQTSPVSEPERILKALEAMGISPSQPPKAQVAEPVTIGKNLDPEAIAKTEQFAHWEFIKASCDAADFARYVEMFPTSSFAGLARMQIGKFAKEAWRTLVGSEDIADLQRFARDFPDDPSALEAKRRVEALQACAEEAQSWNKIKDSRDIAAVEAHLARFPDGANAVEARGKLVDLQREQKALEHWHAIVDGDEPKAFEQFLSAYPDSKFASQARSRIDELRRAREEADWNAVRNERLPAALLRFLKAHPRGVHVAEASKLLVDLPRRIDEEAWSEIKDEMEPSLFQAFLAARPHGQYAEVARARLRELADAQNQSQETPVEVATQTMPDREGGKEERTSSKGIAAPVILIIIMLFLFLIPAMCSSH